MKSKEKVHALKLRRAGKSYSNILKTVRVSKSTLSLWLRDVPLSKISRDKILRGLEKARKQSAKSKKEQRLSAIGEAKEKASTEFPILYQKPLFLVGLSLYWAEGDKNSQERVKFTNSDPRLISIMMMWFRDICGISQEKFRIALHIHSLQINKEVLAFWSKITDIPRGQFQKPYIKKTSLGYRRNPLYNGTCSIVIHSRQLFRKIMAWENILSESFEGTAKSP
ncbi:MAG: hypothetical protein AAB590_00750 [Patescibacteria group bacterium]